jgi:hypothetical protein
MTGLWGAMTYIAWRTNPNACSKSARRRAAALDRHIRSALATERVPCCSGAEPLSRQTVNGETQTRTGDTTIFRTTARTGRSRPFAATSQTGGLQRCRRFPGIAGGLGPQGGVVLPNHEAPRSRVRTRFQLRAVPTTPANRASRSQVPGAPPAPTARARNRRESSSQRSAAGSCCWSSNALVPANAVRAPALATNAEANTSRESRPPDRGRGSAGGTSVTHLG